MGGTGRTLHFFGKLLLFVAAARAVTSPAQTAALPNVSAPPRPVNAAAAPPVFEVTTVKLNKSGSSGSHSSLDNGRFTESKASDGSSHRSAGNGQFTARGVTMVEMAQTLN